MNLFFPKRTCFQISWLFFFGQQDHFSQIKVLMWFLHSVNLHWTLKHLVSSVQSLSCVRLFMTPWTAARQASLPITNTWSLLRLMSIELVTASAISSSVIPFSSCLQPFPASGSFQMSQLFAWGGQSIGVSALVSVLPMSIQDWFHYGNLCAFLINFLSTGVESKANKPSWTRINSTSSKFCLHY